MAAEAPHRAVLSVDVLAAFARRSARTATGEQLALLLEAVAGQLGFAVFALVLDHAGFGSGRPGAEPITTYPDAWRARFLAAGYGDIDPVHAACRQRVMGFCWDRLGTIITLTPSQSAILRESRCFGLGKGFTVPLHLPSRASGSLSFAAAPGVLISNASCYLAQVVAAIAGEVAIRLAGAATSIRLTPRERQCVALLAAGLTDRGIGRELQLSEETVTKYLNAARRRHGLRTRTQLVARALCDGVIDCLDRS